MKRNTETRRLWEPKPFRIISLDPGGTTGWAGSQYSSYAPNPPSLDDIKFNSGQIGPQEHHLGLWRFLCAEYNDSRVPLTVVCESFEFRQHINPQHAKTKVELVSKEYIGVLKLFANQYPLVLVFFQTASAAKTLVSDEKLKALGWWVPGNPHANDAARHLARHMVVTMSMRSPITDRWL